jgi:hypothetical protein
MLWLKNMLTDKIGEIHTAIYAHKITKPGTDVMILKRFSPKDLAKKCRFFTQNTSS